MIENIFVKSKKEMEQASKVIDRPSIVISIRGTDEGLARLMYNPNLIKVMYFEFDDWDKEQDGQLIMSDFDGERMANVIAVFNRLPEPYDLYVNCEAGQSRSAGIAAAVSKVLFDDDEVFFRTKHPNMLCYRKMYDALIKKKEDGKLIVE